MAMRELKRIVRIDPTLGDAINIIAATENKKNYEVLERIIIDYIKENKPELMEKIRLKLIH